MNRSDKRWKKKRKRSRKRVKGVGEGTGGRKTGRLGEMVGLNELKGLF